MTDPLRTWPLCYLIDVQVLTHEGMTTSGESPAIDQATRGSIVCVHARLASPVLLGSVSIVIFSFACIDRGAAKCAITTGAHVTLSILCKSIYNH